MVKLINWFKRRPMLKTSQSGIDLLEQFEGCRKLAYLDWGGVPTIGYGAVGDGIELGVRWTQQQCDDRLIADLVRREKVLNTYNLPLTQNQFDALICLIYNIGTVAFDRSTLLRKLKKGDIQGAADAFLSWHNVNGKPVPGLLNRRNAERRVFLGSE